VVIAVAACKGPYYNFRPSKNIDLHFFSQIPVIDSLASISDSIERNKNLTVKQKRRETIQMADMDSNITFFANFTERLVERDAIPEWKLINDQSDRVHSEIVEDASSGNKNTLYLFILNPGKRNTICIYLGTGRDMNNNYKNLGPAYMGYLRMDRINMKYELKVVKTKNGYMLEQKGKPIDMTWYLDKDLVPQDQVKFLVKRIDYKMPNKIGGKKTVMYNMEHIFNDSTALIFGRGVDL
jgi:hypothetical protein